MEKQSTSVSALQGGGAPRRRYVDAVRCTVTRCHVSRSPVLLVLARHVFGLPALDIDLVKLPGPREVCGSQNRGWNCGWATDL